MPLSCYVTVVTNRRRVSHKTQKGAPQRGTFKTGRGSERWKPSVVTSFGAPKGIRTPASGLKGQCPRPLDDGGQGICIVIYYKFLLISRLFGGCFKNPCERWIIIDTQAKAEPGKATKNIPHTCCTQET